MKHIYEDSCPTADFKFKGIKGGQALVSLFIPDSDGGGDEWHDFRMTARNIKANMSKFGKHSELIKAMDALSKSKA